MKGPTKPDTRGKKALFLPISHRSEETKEKRIVNGAEEREKSSRASERSKQREREGSNACYLRKKKTQGQGNRNLREAVARKGETSSIVKGNAGVTKKKNH